LELLKNFIIRLFIDAFIYYLPAIVFVTVGYFVLANYDNYHIETERKNLFESVKIVSTKDIVFL